MLPELVKEANVLFMTPDIFKTYRIEDGFEEVALCHNSLSKHFIYIRIIILEGDRLHSFGNKQRENKEMDVWSEALPNSR